MKFIVMLGLFTLIGFLMFSPLQAAKATQAAKYTVLQQEGQIEERQYTEALTAEVTVEGGRKTAMREGFQYLYDYISGENETNETISMTVPVVQAYLGKPNGEDAWTIKFFMPPGYTEASTPKPKAPKIKIKREENLKLVAIRFNGPFESDNIRKHRDELERHLKARNIKPRSEEMYAAYNAPWTPSFLRRNEVLFKVD